MPNRKSINNVIYYVTYLIVLLTFFYYLRNEIPFLESIFNYISLLILFLGYGIFGLWLLLGNYRKMHPRMRFIFSAWMFTIIYMFFTPFLLHNYQLTAERLYAGMYHDYRHIMFTLLPFMFVSDDITYYRNKIINDLAKVAIVAGVAGILLADKSIGAIAFRSNTWSASYYLWWMTESALLYWFARSYLGKVNRDGYIIALLYLVLSLLFLKRAGFVNLALLFFLSYVTSFRSIRSLGMFIVLLFFLMVVLFFMQDAVNLIGERFIESSSNIEEFDRLSEAEEYFRRISLFEKWLGFGINNYITMLYIDSVREVNAIHIGFVNILYKGGIVYAAFMLYLFFSILSLISQIGKNIEIKIGLIVGVIFIIGHSYEYSWAYTATIFFVLLPIYRAIHVCDSYRLKHKGKYRLNFQ